MTWNTLSPRGTDDGFAREARISFDSWRPLNSLASLRPDLSLGGVCDFMYASVMCHVDAPTCLYRVVYARARQARDIDVAW